jgi:hypothetical protein
LCASENPKATIPGLTEYGIQTIITQKHSWHYLQLNKNHITQPLYMIQVCLKGKVRLTVKPGLSHGQNHGLIPLGDEYPAAAQGD